MLKESNKLDSSVKKTDEYISLYYTVENLCSCNPSKHYKWLLDLQFAVNHCLYRFRLWIIDLWINELWQQYVSDCDFDLALIKLESSEETCVYVKKYVALKCLKKRMCSLVEIVAGKDGQKEVKEKEVSVEVSEETVS